MTICADTACAWFATDRPCGLAAERPGQPCRDCGRELLVGEAACPSCWTSVKGIERRVASSLEGTSDAGEFAACRECSEKKHGACNGTALIDDGQDVLAVDCLCAAADHFGEGA